MAVTKDFKITVSIDDQASKGFKDLKLTAKDSEETFKGMGFSIIALNQALELGKKALDLFIEPVKEAIAAFANYDKSVNQVRASLSLVGQLTENHVKDFEEFAQQLQRSSNIAEDLSLHLISVAKATGLSDSQTKELIEASAKVSKLMDGDMNAAFQQLLGQYGGMTGRLVRLIPQLQNFTEEQIRAGKGVAFVNKHIGDFAQQDAKSFSGSLEGLKLATGELYKNFGRLIVQTLNLPGAINTVKTIIFDLAHVIESAGPKIESMANAFKAVDWRKIGETFLYLAGAITVLVAIGLTPAIIALGGFGALFSAIGTAVAAIATPILAFVGGLITIVALVGAVELFVRNFDKLGQVFTMLASSAKVFGDSILLALEVGINKTLELTARVLEFFQKTTGVGGDAAASINTQLDESSKRLAVFGVELDKNIEDVKNASKGIDFGATGESLSLISNLIKGISTETKEVVDQTKDYSESGSGPVTNLKDQLKALKEIKETNNSLSNDIANIGATQLEQLQNNLKMEEQKLELKRQQLKTEGLLAGIQGKNITDALDAQKALLEAKAGKQAEMIKHPNVISPDNLAAIKDALGDGAKDFASTIGSTVGSISGVMTGVGAVMGAVTGVLDFMQQLIDFIPQVLGKIANIFNTLTELPNKIVTGFKDVMRSIVNYITNYLPNLLKMIPDLLRSLVYGIFEAIPKAIQLLAASLPNIIIDVLNQLPEIMQNLVTGMITNTPRIYLIIESALIKNAPRLAMAWMKVFYVEMPKAIVNGIVEGGKELIGMLSDFFSGHAIKLPDFAGDIGDKIVKAGKSLAKDASQLFSVKDLEESFKGIDLSTKIGDAIMSSVNYMAGILKRLWQMLKDLWQYIWDKILQPFLDFLNFAWQWAYDHVVGPLVDGLMRVWNFAKDFVVGPIVDGLNAAWAWVKNNIVTPLATIGIAAFQWVYDNVVGGLKGVGIFAFQWVYENIVTPLKTIGQFAFQWVFDNVVGGLKGVGIFAFLWVYDNVVTPLKNIGQSGFQWVEDNIVAPLRDIAKIFDNFRFPEFHWPDIPKPSWWKMPGDGGGDGQVVGGVVGDALSSAGIKYHAMGGPVYASAGMFMPSGTDTVPAMLTPGEFVVNRRASAKYGSFLSAINSGQPAGTGVSIGGITINAKTNLDADGIRREVIPAIEKHLKRASQDGKFLISKSGIRE